MAVPKGRLKNSKGVTLIELLVTLVIGVILMAAIYQMYISGIRTTTVGEQVADMQQNIRVAMDQIMRELRLSGYNPALPGGGGGAVLGETAGGNLLVGNPIQLSNGNYFEFQGDIDGDGAVEIVRYTLDTSSNPGHPILTRQEPGGSTAVPVNFAANIEEMELTFYDSANCKLGIDAACLNLDPTAVRRVTVMLRARTGEEDPNYTNTTINQSTNLPFNDGYRRRTLESDVVLRNVGTSKDATAPSCPSNVTITNTTECRIIRVNWTIPTDIDGDLEGYYIFYSDTSIPTGADPNTLNAPFINVTDQTLSTFEVPVPQMTGDPPFYFAMTSYDRSGNLCNPVVLSAPPSLAPTGNLPPADPGNPTAIPAPNQVTIQWGAVTNVSDIAGYRVYRGTDPSGSTKVMIADESVLKASLTLTGPLHTTEYIDNSVNTQPQGGPLDCNLYYYWVSAVDDCGVESNLTAVMAFDPKTSSYKPGVTPPDNGKSPPAPTITSLVAGDDTSTIIIDWAVPAPDSNQTTPTQVTVYWRPQGTTTWDPLNPAVGSQVIDLTTASLPATGQVIVNLLQTNTIYEVKATTIDDPIAQCGDGVDSSVGTVSTGACAPRVRAHKVVPGINSIGTSIAPYDTVGTDPSITPTSNQNQYITWVVDPIDCTPTSATFDSNGFDFSNPPLYNDVSDDAHVQFFINTPTGADTPAHTVYAVGTSGSNPGNVLHLTNAGDNIDWAPRGDDGYYHFPSDPLDLLHINTLQFCDADYEFKVRIVDGEQFSAESTLPLTIQNGGIAINSNVTVTSNIDTSEDVHRIVTFGINNTNANEDLQIRKVTLGWNNLAAYLDKVEVLDVNGVLIGYWDSITGMPAGRQGIGSELTLNPVPVIQKAGSTGNTDQASIRLTFTKLDGTVNSEVDMRGLGSATNETIQILGMEIGGVTTGNVCSAVPAGSAVIPKDPEMDRLNTVQDQPGPNTVPFTTVSKTSALPGSPAVTVTSKLVRPPAVSIDTSRTGIRYALTTDGRSLAPPRPSAIGGGGLYTGFVPATYDSMSNTLTATIPSNPGTQVWYYLEVVDTGGNIDVVGNFDILPDTQAAYTYAECTTSSYTITLDSPATGTDQTGPTLATATVSGTPYAMAGVRLVVDGQGNIGSQNLVMTKTSADGFLPQAWQVTYNAGSSGTLPHTVTAVGADVCGMMVNSGTNSIN